MVNTPVKPLQPLKALPPIVITGTFNEVKPVQLVKAPPPIVVTEAGMSNTPVKPLQF